MQDRERKKKVALKKARQLEKYARDYMKAKKKIPTGYELEDMVKRNKRRIKKIFSATEKDWNNWKWQLANRISDAETLDKLFPLTEKQKKDFDRIGTKFRWAFTPHYASLMDPDDENCPVRKQMLPDIREMELTGTRDFSGEEYTSPVENLVRWYPDRVAVHVTNICAAFCRHCLRRRKIKEVDRPTSQANLKRIFKYLREHEEIRDVLFTGGDPLTFPDKKVNELLGELDKIEHVEIKRIGSKTPLTLPQRIDKKLCDMLRRHHPVYINIQVSHPREITRETARACEMLADAGIPVGNQTVLLKGINDDVHVMKKLNHELLKMRVRPYYLYHCQGTIGIEHFRTTVEKGMEIVENLRGFTSGLAVPSYIITPSGLGKTPLLPNYQVSAGRGYVMLRNWEGITYRYENPFPE